MEKEPFDLKRFLFGKINRKMTFLFLIVGLVAPAIGIYYFYSISTSVLVQENEIFYQQSALLQTAAILVVILIAVDTGIVGFFVSRSISKPISQLYKTTQEIEKGNFNVRTNIKTNDELEQLGNAFNKTAEALSRMDEERSQVDKAKSEFLSITSHELRTPITPMKAQLQMLENEYFGKLTNKQKESIKIIIRNADRLNKIIEDFLEISRIEAARLKFVFKETNIKETINETVEFMTGFAKEKNIKLVVNTGKLPVIEVDPDRIIQVLRNLIHNAIKFSHPDSTIEIGAVAKDDHILFSVTDHGVGMTPEDQIQVFEPFYQIEGTLDRKHGGTGLGLAICRGIIESQHGKIWVESKLGAGSTFYFTVPFTPVRDLEPIKVLFSARGDIEKKIKEEFTANLGPMGIVEFNDLKNRHALRKRDLLDYIDSLGRLSILDKKREEEFKTNILAIFGDEKNIVEKEEVMM